MGQPKLREVTPLPVSGQRPATTGTSGSMPAIPSDGLFAARKSPALPPPPPPRRPPMTTTPSLNASDEAMTVEEHELISEPSADRPAPVARPREIVLSKVEYDALTLDIGQKVSSALKADPAIWAPSIMTPGVAVVLVQVILGNKDYRKLFMNEIAKAIKSDEEWASALIDRGIERRNGKLLTFYKELTKSAHADSEEWLKTVNTNVTAFIETVKGGYKKSSEDLETRITQFDEARADLASAEEARNLGNTVITQLQEKSTALEQATSDAAAVIARIETERTLTEQARDAAIKSIADAEQRLIEREKRLDEQEASLKRATDALNKALDKKPTIIRTGGSSGALWLVLVPLLLLGAVFGAIYMGWIDSPGKTSSHPREATTGEVLPVPVTSANPPAAPPAVQTPPPAKPVAAPQPAKTAPAPFPPDPDSPEAVAPPQKEQNCIHALTSGVTQTGDKWSRTVGATTWTCRVFNENAISSTVSQLCDCEKGPAVP